MKGKFDSCTITVVSDPENMLEGRSVVSTARPIGTGLKMNVSLTEISRKLTYTVNFMLKL